MVTEDIAVVDDIVEARPRGPTAYESYGTQALFDSACQAVAWSLMEPQRNRQLAELAVAQTGLGNADDKVRKNHNKTLGLMRDLKGVTAFGHVGMTQLLGLRPICGQRA